MLPRIVIVSLLGLAACAPQNAQMTRGFYTAFLSLNTSPVFVTEDIDLAAIGERSESWSWDCRGVDDDIKFSDPDHPTIDNCRPGGAGVEYFDGISSRRMLHEVWADRDAFVAVREELDPWRGEAVMTSEGDLNITFHHRLPGGNFRFAISVRPDFAPRRCVERDGVVQFEPIDGDWIANWTRAVTEPNYDAPGVGVHFPPEFLPPGSNTDGSLFFLNSTAYQFNPSDSERIWSLPPVMRAGYTRARWGPEELLPVPTRFGTPSAYLSFDEAGRGPSANQIFYRPLNPDNFTDNYEAEVRSTGAFIELMRQVERVSDEIQEDLTSVYGPNRQADMHKPVVPSNAWRRPDGRPEGFAGWGELGYSWIRFDQDRSEIQRGADLTGNFHVRYFGANSQSQFFVQGEFVIENIKRDRWITRDVNREQRDINETTVCGERL